MTTPQIKTSPMKEAKRWPGSEWLKNHPRLLEVAYDGSKATLRALYPLLKRISPAMTEKLLIGSEEVLKGYAFNCQMCGQCILHSTGMTCPMNCPKNLRNGPCGGVRRQWPLRGNSRDAVCMGSGVGAQPRHGNLSRRHSDGSAAG